MNKKSLILKFNSDIHTGAVAVWGLLLVLAAVAWVFTIRDALHMGNMPGTMGLGPVAFLIMWTLMMAAMMLPSLAPVTVLYLKARARISHKSPTAAAQWHAPAGFRSVGVLNVPSSTPARSSVAKTSRDAPLNHLATDTREKYGPDKTRGQGILTILGLAVGYLLAWAVFGLFAYGAAYLAGRLAMTHSISPWLGTGIIAVCGLYQFTPLKQVCLNHCRSPVSFLLHFGNYRGRFRDVYVGFYHGGYCAGCCIGLMVIMVAVGVMNITWMVVLAAVIFIEKVWRYGKEFAIAVGVLLILMAGFVPWHPWLLPGLYHLM